MYQIVGVAGNTKYRDLRGAFVPIIFVAQSQDSSPGLDSTILIRSDSTPSSLISSLKSVAEQISPSIVLNFHVLRASILESLVRERLMATLSAVYGVLAAVLSMIGLYGIISYMAVRRKNEIGVRIALGASKGNILGMVLREAMILLAIGLVAGTLLASAAGGAIRAMLFGLKPTDPLTFLLAITSLTIVAGVASVIPAVRAAAVDPMQVLREE